jgi:succinate dehydrogenase / fumarate reductase flavoprotein subunit
MSEYSFSVIIVGHGAAALREADALLRLGRRSVALVCENRKWGTSRNTGSDKQTYYKLSAGGKEPDSVRAMAESLFQGGAVDGDQALLEAALSSESFYHLVELGVPFPRNPWGEYVGYKTDHDETRRATSAGPYTSKFMVEALERDLAVPLFEHEQVCRIMVGDGVCKGIVCWNTETEDFDLFYGQDVVLATGGPASLFRSSVYPASQHGASGVAYEAGAEGRNLTEWQQGLASLRPRWNVSGTYMQAMPKFVSTEKDGTEGREFLLEEKKASPSLVFLKGYQWPFDIAKAKDGSSLIDLLVEKELLSGRRVFLDYRENPSGLDFSALLPEAKAYLSSAGALCGTPYERLERMNMPAVELYRSFGVDLKRERLEISLCVQHANGGIAVDDEWCSTIPHLSVIGEAACTHGIHRPGGSALNAGQVGALRNARFLAKEKEVVPEGGRYDLAPLRNMVDEALRSENEDVSLLLQEVTTAMSLYAGAVREKAHLESTLSLVEGMLQKTAHVSSKKDVSLLFRLRDVLFCARSCLVAMLDYLSRGYGSRGGALYTDPKGEKPADSLPDLFRYTMGKSDGASMTQCVRSCPSPAASWRPVRPIPPDDDFFEVVWKEYREGKC